MARELTHKRLKPGTLVLVNRLNEYGIVISEKVNYENLSHLMNCMYSYVVLVKGEKVKAYGGGLTVIGDD